MWLTCLCCGDTKLHGETLDKKVRLTTCSDFCKAVLMSWSNLPDPRPSVFQHYLNTKHPEREVLTLKCVEEQDIFK